MKARKAIASPNGAASTSRPSSIPQESQGLSSNSKKEYVIFPGDVCKGRDVYPVRIGKALGRLQNR